MKIPKWKMCLYSRLRASDTTKYSRLIEDQFGWEKFEFRGGGIRERPNSMPHFSNKFRLLVKQIIFWKLLRRNNSNILNTKQARSARKFPPEWKENCPLMNPQKQDKWLLLRKVIRWIILKKSAMKESMNACLNIWWAHYEAAKILFKLTIRTNECWSRQLISSKFIILAEPMTKLHSSLSGWLNTKYLQDSIRIQ